MFQRPILGIETVGLLHRDPAGSFALGFRGRFAVGPVKGLRISQTFGDVMLDIFGVLRRTWLDALRLAVAGNHKHEEQPADDCGQGQPIAQLHDGLRAAPLGTSFSR